MAKLPNTPDIIVCIAHNEPLEDELGYHGYCPECAYEMEAAQMNLNDYPPEAA